MKPIFILLMLLMTINASSKKVRSYKLSIQINASKETIWEAITDFKNYPNWNSILRLANNDQFVLDQKFDVTILKPKHKQSKFKANLVHKKSPYVFTAVQTMIAPWFFQAKHHFIIEEIDANHSIFIQKWELYGLLSVTFTKQIFKELELFTAMNGDLKTYIEYPNLR